MVKLLQKNEFALKEWASIVRGMGAGALMVMLRKGGILEVRNGFEVEHREFFFYPTFEHQSAEQLVPTGQQVLKDVEAEEESSGKIPVEYYAEVENEMWVDDLEKLKRLEGEHWLTPESVQMRYHYGKKKGLWVIPVRVYRLPDPVAIEEKPEYAGCRSWVPLEKPLSTQGAVPVIPDGVFADSLARIVDTLE